MMMRHQRKQRGLTIIELMIAVTLSAIITAAIASLFIQSRRSNEQNDLIARMQESGRFAMQALREEMLHADFFGDLSDPTVIKDGSLTALSTNCGSADWYKTLDNASDRINYDQNVSSANGIYNCISDSTYIANGNLLAIKRAKANPVDNDSASADDKVYFRSNGTSATLYHFTDATDIPSLGGNESDWEYYVNIFYVRNKDNTPVLYRHYLKPGSTPTMEAEPLVENVEYFHVQFGIDTDDDGISNYYDFAPTNAELSDAVSARIYVLVRAEKTSQGYSNTKTYNMGAGISKTVNDGYYRRLYSTTVMLKNPRNQRLLGQ